MNFDRLMTPDEIKLAGVIEALWCKVTPEQAIVAVVPLTFGRARITFSANMDTYNVHNMW